MKTELHWMEPEVEMDDGESYVDDVCWMVMLGITGFDIDGDKYEGYNFMEKYGPRLKAFAESLFEEYYQDLENDG